MRGRQVHHSGTLLLSIVMAAIGLALIVQAVAGGVLSVRLLLGALFVAGGVGRIFVERKRGEGQ
jgi:hypothetical protein